MGTPREEQNITCPDCGGKYVCGDCLSPIGTRCKQGHRLIKVGGDSSVCRDCGKIIVKVKGKDAGKPSV